MIFNSLRDFIEILEQHKLLVRIKEPVSSVLEITEIQTRVLQERGPALLFENVFTENGPNNIMVLANLFGSVQRIAAGMGIDCLKPDISPSLIYQNLREIGENLTFLRQPQPPHGWKEAAEMLPLLKKLIAMQPKTVKKAPCQEVVLTGEDIDLSKLPIQTCWPGEPAPLITWPLVVSQGPSKKGEDGFNLGIYRMQVISKNQTIMRWLKHRGGAMQHQRWKEIKNEPFPVAAVIGADPATIISAVTPVPETLSEYQFSGLLRGEKVELVDCKTIPLKVPAQAEIILEGYVSLNDYRNEGPYGDHTGYYNSVEQFPVFTISAITMREKPIYLSTFTSRPPDEPSILGEALNEVFVPLLIQQFPEIVDFYLPPEGCSYRIAVVSIKKAYPGHARKIMMGIWSFLRQFMYTKFIIVVDDDINIRKWDDVIWAISTRVDAARDTVIIENTPIDYLDFASPESGLGSKMGIDATNKMPPETKREWGNKIYMDKDIIEKVTQNWVKYGIPGKGEPIW